MISSWDEGLSEGLNEGLKSLWKLKIKVAFCDLKQDGGK